MLRNLVMAGTTAICTSAAADPVTLQSNDGTMDLQGELKGFEDNQYILETSLGELRIAANQVYCIGAACPSLTPLEVNVRIGGSEDIAEVLMPLMMAGFATSKDAESTATNTANHGEFVVSLVGQQGFGDPLGSYLVSANTSDGGFEGLMNDSLQVALSARPVQPEEAIALASAGAGDMSAANQEHIVALDGLLVVVNKDNPVNELAVSDIARIFSGQVTNWAEVGGQNLPIQVVAGNPDTEAVFNAEVFGSTPPQNAPRVFTADDAIDASNYISANAGAIGYVGFAFRRDQKPLTLISECGISTEPSAFAVKAEEYAFFRRLYFYNRGDLADPMALDLVNYAGSDAANGVITQSGLINLGVERVELGLSGPRAATTIRSATNASERRVASDMLALMADHDRLSSTFRFQTGSAILDPRGQADLVRLANYLSNVPAGTEVTFVGFADSMGAFESNLSLAQSRAVQVRTALEAVAGERLRNVTFNTTGFGELSPAACNTSVSGRETNRRVETWISTR